MYEMLTDDLPFRGGSSIDISLRHIGEKPQPPSKVFSGIPEDFEKIIMNCLEKAPPDRYQTVIELGQDLENFTEGRKLNIDRLHKDGHRRKKKTTIYAGAGQYEELFERYNRRKKSSEGNIQYC